MELAHDLLIHGSWSGGFWHERRQAIYDVHIEPAPTRLQVMFRTALKAVAAVFVYRVSGGGFESDSAKTGAMVTYHVDESPVRQHSMRMQEQIGSGEPLEQNTTYWVKIVCSDQNNAPVEFVSLARTWKRTASFAWYNTKIVNDSDGGGRGELMFSLQLFDNITGRPVSDMDYTAERSLNTGEWFGETFRKITIGSASNVLGFYLKCSDDDALGVYYVGTGFPSAPWNEHHLESTNGGFMSPDTALIYDTFELPDDEGTYFWTLTRNTIEDGRLRFRAYIKIEAEIIATAQPIVWWSPPEPRWSAVSVIDVTQFPDGLQIGNSSSDQGDRAMRLVHAPDGSLFMSSSDERRSQAAAGAEPSFVWVKAIRSRNAKDTPALVALDKAGNLRFGKLHLRDTPGIEWEQHNIAVRGEPVIAMSSNDVWEVIAISLRGEPIKIRPGEKPVVIGPAIDITPTHLIAIEANDYWRLVMADNKGQQYILLATGQSVAWSQLPNELGDVLHGKVHVDGQTVLLGLGTDRSVRIWDSKQVKVDILDRLETLISSHDFSPPAECLSIRDSTAKPQSLAR